MRIYAEYGSFVETKAVCDSASSQTWIDEDLIQSLGLEGRNTSMSVNGFHGTNSMDCLKVPVKIGLADEISDTVKIISSSYQDLVVGSSVYNVIELSKRYPHLSCIKLKKIDLKDIKVILGQDAYSLIRPLEYKYCGKNSPWAVKVPLGWTLSGPLPNSERRESSFLSSDSQENQELTEIVRKWWEIESYGTTFQINSRTLEDEKSLEILEKKTLKLPERFQVQMLFTGKEQKLDCNISSALGQLRSLERRLAKKRVFKIEVHRFNKKDPAKGYITLLEKGELERSDFWYLPHHPVVNPRKPEKVRRVCNAAKKFRGYCLNDDLMKGPDHLQNLIGTLFRFRENCVALTADVEEMFLQIQVPEKQKRYLRFLWADEDGKLMPYQYNRHIFGAKLSLTCANCALQQSAKLFGLEHPIASHVVMDIFYVDDLLPSVHTIEQASEVIHDLKSLLAKGGFNLTKRFSNFEEIFENSEITPIESEDNPKVLGLEWIAADDLLTVRKDQEFLQKRNWTHRQVLSTVSQVFDPLGFMALFVIRGRMLMKPIWQTQGQNLDISTDFNKWVQEWSNSKQLPVSRW